MIDFYNFIIAIAATMVLAYAYARLKNRRDGAIGSIAAFIIGMAFHSTLLHEKARQGWKFPWDHDAPEISMGVDLANDTDNSVLIIYENLPGGHMRIVRMEKLK